MALKGHFISGGLVGPLAGIESGSANDIAGFDGSAVAGTRSLSNLLDAVIGSNAGTIAYRDSSSWKALAPADGYLHNASGALSWASVASPPVWKLIETRTVNGDEVFSGLAGYQEIGLIISNVGASANGIRSLVVSTDNGSTFLTTSGDYQAIITTSGAANNSINVPFHTSINTTGVYGWMFIKGFSLAGPKIIVGSVSAWNMIVPTATPLNAIKLFNNSSGTPNSGTIYLLGLPGV